ncbi:MAG: VWA domain-containing protein, partial [Akkermansia sp.]
MSFLYPSLLTLLILPLLLGLVALILNSRRQSTWRKLVSEQHERELVKRRPTWKTTIPALLILLASSLAIIALARPINGFEESEEAASSRNLIIALDISRSMETQDVRPSRLEEARAAAYELIDALPSDKIGLIVFSGEADLVVPLTYDHAALKEILSHVKRDWIPTGGTNFGMVLEKATQDLQRSAPTGSNALIIFSDGEDTVGEDSKELARQAKKNNLLVITVGVGTEAGGAIPDPQGENGLYQDSQGKHVISSLKIPQLQEFAHATGGDFFIMGAGADLSEFALRAAEKIDRHDDTSSINKVPRDLFSYFLIPALGLMLLGLIMSTDWKNVTLRRFHSAPLLLLAFLLMGQSTRAQEQPATACAPGLAAMQEADEATARDAFSRALLSEDKELQAAASYQLSKMSGELHFDELRQLYADEQGQPKQASSKELEALRPKFAQDLKNFEDTLSLQADMEQAQQATKGMKEFLTALDEEIERLKQQEQQQQQQDQDQDKSDQQDEPKDEPQDQDKSDQQDE